MNAVRQAVIEPKEPPDRPIDWSRVFEVQRRVDNGAISAADGIKAVSREQDHVWFFTTDPDLSPLDLPRWPLRLVLAWILHKGDTARVAEAYDDVRHWRLSPSAAPDRRDAYHTLQHALACGRVTATARRNGSARAPIAVEEWEDLRPALSGSGVIFRKGIADRASVYSDIVFDAAAIKALWQPLTRARAASKATIKMKTDAELNLTAMMRADPENPISKAEVRKQAAYAGVPKRTFDDVWKAAVIAAKAPAWGASGRRPKRHPSPASSA